MGQYHYVVNLDKHEVLIPWGLGDGLKLREMSLSGPGGTLTGLAVLLAVSNGRGGGDFEEHGIVGRWGGDRIAIVGDYAERADLPEADEAELIYERVGQGKGWFDVTPLVRDYLTATLGFTYAGTGWLDRSHPSYESTKTLAPDIIIR